MIWIILIALLGGAFCYVLLVVGSGSRRDWERDDAEQEQAMKMLQEGRRQKSS